MKLRRIFAKFWPFVTKRFHQDELMRNNEFWQNRYRPLDEQAVSKIVVTTKPKVRLLGPYAGNPVEVELEHFINRQVIVDWDFWITGNSREMISHFILQMAQDTESLLIKHLCNLQKTERIKL